MACFRRKSANPRSFSATTATYGRLGAAAGVIALLIAAGEALAEAPAPHVAATPSPSPSAAPVVTAAAVSGFEYGNLLRQPFPSPSPGVTIESLLKPAVLRKVVDDREVMTHASLDDLPRPGEPENRRYSYYAAMRVNADAKTTRQILTDYQLYAKLIPYIDRAEFHPADQTLTIEGGIWKFRLSSTILFHEASDRLIQYRIVAGHFRGLEGEIRFEKGVEKGTLVYLAGEQDGSHWPPKWVIERGAEVVFGFTGRKMRGYIEDNRNGTRRIQEGKSVDEQPKKSGPAVDELPQPLRRH